MTQIISFGGDPSKKEKALNIIDNYAVIPARQKYFNEGWGFPAGEALAQQDELQEHGPLYSNELGIPTALFNIERHVYYCLPRRKAKRWARRFVEAIPVGQDLRAAAWACVRSLSYHGPKDTDDQDRRRHYEMEIDHYLRREISGNYVSRSRVHTLVGHYFSLRVICDYWSSRDETYYSLAQALRSAADPAMYGDDLDILGDAVSHAVDWYRRHDVSRARCGATFAKTLLRSVASPPA